MASSDHEATLMSQYAAEEIAMLMDQNQRYENALRRLKLEAPHYKAEHGHLLAFVEGVAQAALTGTEVTSDP